MSQPLRVLMITSAWPQPGRPQTTHFIKRQAEFLQKAGVDVDVFHFQGSRQPVNYVRAWARVRPRLRPERYDLVHGQFGQSGLLALPKRMPLVVTLRGSDLLGIVGPGGRHTRQGRLLQSLTRFVVRRADAVVMVSEHMRAHLPEGVVAMVLPSGLDLELFRPTPRAEARQRLGLPQDRRLVLFAANPDLPRKRHWLAESAMTALRRRMDADLIVTWGVRHTEMPLYMSACDAMIFTSMQEGSPNVVKEALACDMPVVSVPIGDVALRMQGIEGCEVTADEDPETLASALERVLERGGRVRGRETVEHLDEYRTTERLIGIYHSVLDGRRARPQAHPPATPAASPALASRAS